MRLEFKIELDQIEVPRFSVEAVEGIGKLFTLTTLVLNVLDFRERVEIVFHGPNSEDPLRKIEGFKQIMESCSSSQTVGYDLGVSGRGVVARLIQDQRLHLGLVGVWKLRPVGLEDLDAVVGVWVVGGGDDDAGVEVVGPGQVGHARRRQHPRHRRLAARLPDAAHQAGTYGHAGLAGVVPQDDPAGPAALPEKAGDRLAEVDHGLLVEREPARRPADAVGAEQSL